MRHGVSRSIREELETENASHVLEQQKLESQVMQTGVLKSLAVVQNNTGCQ